MHYFQIKNFFKIIFMTINKNYFLYEENQVTTFILFFAISIITTWMRDIQTMVLTIVSNLFFYR